jgi:WD40 repeat protein
MKGSVLLIFSLVCLVLIVSSDVTAQDTYEILQIAWNPAGTEIAIAGGSYPCSSTEPERFPISVFVVSTGEMEDRYFGHHCPQVDVNWSPDGKKLASSSDSGEPTIWDTSSHQILLTTTIGGPFGREMVWSPDGTKIASVAGGYYGYVWDAISGQLLYELPDHGQPTTSVSWNPDGNQLATSSLDNTVRVWDSSTRAQVLLLQHNAPVYWAAWSPDGTLIATTGSNGFVGIWSAQNGILLKQLTGHTDSVYVVDWSPDGTRIATGGVDETVRTWDVQSGELLDLITSPLGLIVDLDWSPVDDRIAFIGIETASQDGIPEIFEASAAIPSKHRPPCRPAR